MADSGAKPGIERRSPGLSSSDSPTDFGVELVPQEVSFPVELNQRYACLAELGRGGMGVVYRVRDLETGEVIALKVLRPEVAANQDINERFKAELRLARLITHKNVCRIYDFNRFGDIACISMELVQGESLRATLQRLGNLSIRAATRITAQICAAMREAHKQGIVHRDLKPENVMLDANGDVKVMDFGLAISTTDAHDGLIGGTPAYMSPEQIEGKPTDTRSDIYAIGLLLYEMITGWLPFEGETAAQRAKNTLTKDPKSLRDYEPSVTFGLEGLVLRCLRRHPDERIQSAEQVEALLRESVDDAQLQQPVVPKRLKVWTAADWCISALGVAGLFVFLQLWNGILPALRYPMELDQLSAKRQAEQTLKAVGIASHSLEVSPTLRATSYRDRLSFALMPAHRGEEQTPKTDLESVRFPLDWWGTFVNEPWRAMLGSHDDSIRLDRQGHLIEVRKNVTGSDTFLPRYSPATLDARRNIATSIAQQACGIQLSTPPRIEYSGGEWGASYSATWQPLHPPGTPPIAKVSLWAEKPVEVACPSAFEAPMSEMPKIWNYIGNLAMVVPLLMILATMVWFAVGRLYTSPLLLRRAPLAIVMGVATNWLFSAPFHSSSIPYPALLISGSLASSVMWLIAVVSLEHRMDRLRPDMIATWTSLLRGNILENGVTLAFIRGTTVGGVLAGTQSVLGWLSLHLPQQSSPAHQLVPIFSGIPDVSNVGEAITSGLPMLYVVATVFINAIAVAFLGLGCSFAWSRREFQNISSSQTGTAKAFNKAILLFAVAVFTASVAAGLRLSFGGTVGFGLGSVFIPGIMCFILAVVAYYYDMLTAIVGVATATLLALNTSLIALLPESSTTALNSLFVIWGVLLLSAIVIGFRHHLSEAIKEQQARLR